MPALHHLTMQRRELFGKDARESVSQLIEPLGLRLYSKAYLVQDVERPLKPVALHLQHGIHDTAEPTGQLIQPFHNLIQYRYHRLCCRRRCGSTMVCGKVRKRHIDFMPHGGDHRNSRPGDGTNHRFFIKRPQIFRRATTTPDYQHLHLRHCTQRVYGLRNRCTGSIALNRNRGNEDIDDGTPTAKHGHNIANRRPGQ